MVLPNKMLKVCSRCGYSIGFVTYSSGEIEGQYCSSDCYTDAMIDHMGWRQTIKESLEKEELNDERI